MTLGRQGRSLLDLAPLVHTDVDDVFAIFSDASTWLHFPHGCHTHVEQSRDLVAESVRSWSAHGLGSWAVRVTESTASEALPEGTLVGTGGIRSPHGSCRTTRRRPSLPVAPASR